MDFSIDEWGRLQTEPMFWSGCGPVIPSLPDAGRRSGEWPAFLHHILTVHPLCLGCGRKAVTGHHEKPFHLFPQFELVESNILPVCLACHFVLCHAGNWRLYVVDARKRLEYCYTGARAAIGSCGESE